MKRLLTLAIVIAFFEGLMPTFLPLSWSKIEPIEWQPIPSISSKVEITDHLAPIELQDKSSHVSWRLKSNASRVQARFMSITGGESLNGAVYQVVRESLLDAGEFAGRPYSPEAQAPKSGLSERDCLLGSTLLSAEEIIKDERLGPPKGNGTAIVCDVVFARGSVFAQRIRTVIGNEKGVKADSSAIIYQDSNTGESWLAEDSWNESGQRFVWDSFIEAMRSSMGVPSIFHHGGEIDEAALSIALKSTIPDEDGAMIVTFPADVKSDVLLGAVGKSNDQEISIKIPGEQLDIYLTPEGKILRDTAVASVAYSTPPYVFAGFDYIDCDIAPCVAVTYDDGPDPQKTPVILDAYAKEHSATTFFVLGLQAQKFPDVLARQSAEGHSVQNHSWSHADLTLMKKDQLLKEINDTDAIILATTGVEARSFRPPYGSVTDQVVRELQRPAILWDVDTNDWRAPAKKILIERAVNDAWPGSIVLQHDIQKNTAETVTEVIHGLKDRGFSLVTIEQLFGGGMPSTGIVYREG